MSNPSIDIVADAIGAAVAGMSDDERELAAALYDTLARGRPVEPTRLDGFDPTTVQDRLGEWPGVYRDEHGRVVGFWGLAIPEMPHRFHAENGEPMHAWCAIDPLLIVPVLNRGARTESKDPVSGATIRMTVTPGGVTEIDPPTAMMSLLVPDGPLSHDVIATFCHFVLLFESEATGREWTADHPGTALYSIADAFEIAAKAWAPIARARDAVSARGET